MTTLQDLKNNRSEIIECLTSKFGAENLKSAMSMMVDMVNDEFEEFETWEDIVDDIEEMDLFRERKMRTADYLAALNNHESFDMKKYYASKQTC